MPSAVLCYDKIEKSKIFINISYIKNKRCDK